MTGLWAGRFRVRFPAEVRYFLFFRMSRLAQWLTPSSYKMVTWGSVLGETQLRCEANYPPPSVAEVNEWSYTSTPSLCLYVVDMGTMYCTFAFITDFVTYPANCPMVPGDPWHGCQTVLMLMYEALQLLYTSHVSMAWHFDAWRILFKFIIRFHKPFQVFPIIFLHL